MQRYLNLDGNSGVVAYETGADFIVVEFADGGAYLYTYASAGPDNIETMKTLALKGRGLSTFIVRNVRKAYASKLRSRSRRFGSPMVRSRKFETTTKPTPDAKDQT